MHIARVCEWLPRFEIQFRISRSFRPRNPANLGFAKGIHPKFDGNDENIILCNFGGRLMSGLELIKRGLKGPSAVVGSKKVPSD